MGKLGNFGGEKLRDDSSRTGKEVANVNIGVLMLPGTREETEVALKSTFPC